MIKWNEKQKNLILASPFSLFSSALFDWEFFFSPVVRQVLIP